jgi:2-methylcitrate dehydratase PrpD
MTTVVERLAAFVCSLSYEDIPERVLEKARYQWLNVMASLHAGEGTRAGQAVLRAALRRNETGPCTVIPGGQKLPLRDAVAVNAAYAMALDYDDYLYMGHTGHSAVLASMAIAERDSLSTREMLVAQVIANELGGRMGASAVLGPQNGQAWSFIHALEGAAVAARLFRLSEKETAHALAIAIYQPPFTLWPGFMGPESKVMTAAWPTVMGIEAAELAREGLTGALAIFEHPRKGFWASFTYVPLPGMMTGLGKGWLTDTLAYKRYPGCAYIDTTMDALFAALEKARAATGKPVTADDVEAIRVEASLLTVEMDNLSAEHVDEKEPLSPVNINFSIAYNVALGIIAGRHTSRELEQGFLDQHQVTVRDLARRTTLVHDWTMSAQVAEAFAGGLGSRSPAAQLKGRDWLRVLSGYRSQMGGEKKNSLRVEALLDARSLALGKRARAMFTARRGEKGGPPDLGDVDFARFRMCFPARVTLRLRSGQEHTALQEIPFGAPGSSRYLETVEEKVLTEASPRLSVAGARGMVVVGKDLERHGVRDLIRAAVGTGTDAVLEEAAP